MIAEEHVVIPQAGEVWRHQGNGRLYRVLGPGRGRLLGGQWRDGVVYAAHRGGGLYWRCLMAWHQSFVRHAAGEG